MPLFTEKWRLTSQSRSPLRYSRPTKQPRTLTKAAREQRPPSTLMSPSTTSQLISQKTSDVSRATSGTSTERSRQLSGAMRMWSETGRDSKWSFSHSQTLRLNQMFRSSSLLPLSHLLKMIFAFKCSKHPPLLELHLWLIRSSLDQRAQSRKQKGRI